MHQFNIQLKKENNSSYIAVGKFLKFPCRYEGARYYRSFRILGLHFTVAFCDTEGVAYIYPFVKSGINIALKIKKKSLKARHYVELQQNSFDEEYIRKEIHKITRKKLGYSINFYEPKTFNEKIIWMKLFEKDPLITTCCDKYCVKKYVADTIGEKYTLPVLRSWENPSEVSFEGLPERFVIKVNWSSGYNIIVKDRKKFNEFAARKIIEKWMLPESNSYYHFFNYGYKNVRPVVYIEPYIEETSGQLNDYKLFINNGRLVFILMASDRYGEEGNLTYYDPDFNKLPFTRGKKNNKDVPKPEHFDLMADLATRLAAPFKFVRVDFYEDCSHNIYVGEMTFYTAGGLTPFHPSEWDLKLGEMIDLQTENTEVSPV